MKKLARFLLSLLKIGLLCAVISGLLAFGFARFYLPWGNVRQSLSGETKPGIRVINLRNVPVHVAMPVVVAEDHKFYQHNGFNFNEIRRALKNWADGKSALRGASSLSQQTSRILFLSNRRSLIRKALEAIVTLELEDRFSKDEILALYLSNVQWGKTIYGLSDAAAFYFDKRIPDLTPIEAVVLAAMLPNPEMIYKNLLDEKLSSKLRSKLLKLSVWSRVIESQMVVNTSEGSLYLSKQLHDKSLGKVFFDAWIGLGLDVSEEKLQFSDDISVCLDNLRRVHNERRQPGTL